MLSVSACWMFAKCCVVVMVGSEVLSFDMAVLIVDNMLSFCFMYWYLESVFMLSFFCLGSGLWNIAYIGDDRMEVEILCLLSSGYG